jgi:hypothetical protein
MEITFYLKIYFVFGVSARVYIYRMLAAEGIFVDKALSTVLQFKLVQRTVPLYFLPLYFISSNNLIDDFICMNYPYALSALNF